MLLIALWAGIAMICTDVLAVAMVQAEAANRGWLAGVLDALGWVFSIATTSISVAALNGHDSAKKIAVILAVTIANLIGSRLGVATGQWLLRHTGKRTVEDRVRDLETIVGRLRVPHE